MTPPASTPDVQLQRAIIYACTGLIVLTGLVLAVAFKDPCASAAVDPLAPPCTPSLGDRMPGASAYLSLGIIFASMVLCFELRWALRSALVGILGAGQVLAGIVLASDGGSMVFAVCNGLLGLALIGSAVGIQHDRRAAWAFAGSICGTLTVVYFFGAAKVQSATGWSVAWAVLPSLAAYLPTTVVLALTAPGRPRPR
jgi:hypothetical protein